MRSGVFGGVERAVMAALALSGCNGGPQLAPAGVDGLDDAFAGDSLAPGWRVLNGDSAKISVQGGELVMEPTRNVVWYHAEQGPLVYKLVTGNFRVTTVARARKASDATRPPDTGYQFGGLMARSPSSDEGRQDHVFNVVGYRGEHLSVETKTTKQDYSYVQGPPWGSGDAELRICRMDSHFFLHKRPVGGTEWELAMMYRRPDLPATLQVGLIAYSYTDAFDLRASFEGVTFAPVATADDCTRD